MRKPISQMTIKELFQSDLTDLVQRGLNYGFITHNDVKDYIIERCQKELDVDCDNFYTLKKLVLRRFVEVEEYDYENQKIEIEKPSGEWEILKQSNIYKQIMKNK